MEWYISFSNDTILDGVALPEWFLKDQTDLTISRDAPPTFTNVPIEEVAVEDAAPIGGPLRNQLHPRYHMRSGQRWRLPKLVPWLGESAAPLPVSHCCWTSPSGLQQVEAETPHWSSGKRRAQHQMGKECLQVEWAEQDSSLPKSPELIQIVALPPGFKEVTACLQRHLSPATTFEVPLEPTQPEVMVKPMVAMVCASCIVQDETSGVTYMENSHHFCGASGPQVFPPGNPNPWAHHRECHWPPLKKKLITASGQKDYYAIWQENTHRRHHQPPPGRKIP